MHESRIPPVQDVCPGYVRIASALSSGSLSKDNFCSAHASKHGNSTCCAYVTLDELQAESCSCNGRLQKVPLHYYSYIHTK